MTDPAALGDLTDEITACRACPRLVAWRERVAHEKRASFRDEHLLGPPRPGVRRRAAHGSCCSAWRLPRTAGTGRGGCSPETARATGSSAPSIGSGSPTRPSRCRRATGCASRTRTSPPPFGARRPTNKPTPDERDRCQPFLERELALLEPTPGRRGARSVRVRRRRGACWGKLVWRCPRRGLAFGHAVEVTTPSIAILGCYHPSQQNTFTGRLTEPMLDAVLLRARARVGLTAMKTERPTVSRGASGEREDLADGVHERDGPEHAPDDQPQGAVRGADREL